MVRYLFHTIGDLTYQSPLVLKPFVSNGGIICWNKYQFATGHIFFITCEN